MLKREKYLNQLIQSLDFLHAYESGLENGWADDMSRLYNKYF